MGQFDSIRPYHDHEVAEVLQRLAVNPEFLNTIAKYRFPRLAKHFCWLVRPLISYSLRKELADINSVADLQARIAPYVENSVKRATDGISFSGIEHLTGNQPHLFLSNHRDIVMDPAYVNYALFQSQINTPRLAIGDNLLQRPFVSDLMRLNKSFIVQRSVTGRREKIDAFMQLSSYINHSILQEQQSVWIAQAEGRAKDGDDRTDSAILKMLHMSQRELEFNQAISQLSLTPVVISYEYDPCDLAKARELYIKATTGKYAKQAGEDDTSIVLGITGYKGRVHVHFSEAIANGFTDARELAQQIDQIVWRDYRLFPINYLAWHTWAERDQTLLVPAARELFTEKEVAQAQSVWQKKLADCPAEQRPFLIMQYANPLQNQYRSQAQ